MVTAELQPQSPSAPSDDPDAVRRITHDESALLRVVGLPPVYARYGSGDAVNHFTDGARWFDDLLPGGIEGPGSQAGMYLAVGEVASHAVAQGPLPEIVGYESDPDPDLMRALGHITDLEVEDKVNEWLMDATLMDVIERFDPEDLIDPDRELLANCADIAILMSQDYDGLEDFPATYLKDLYARELRYVEFGMDRLDRLFILNEIAAIPITKVNVLFDFDRSQVALVVPHRKPKVSDAVANANFEGTTESSEEEQYHLVRPGWSYLVRRMQRELAQRTQEGIGLRIGAVSDRPQYFEHDQEYDNSGKSLVDIAREHFEAAGIDESLVDDSLIISSTNGDLVQDLPDPLRTTMRKMIRRDVNDNVVRIPKEELVVIAEEQRTALIDAGLSTAEQLADPDFEYHEKLGVLIALARRMEAGEVALLFDDLAAVRYIESAVVVGGHVDFSIQPLLPDDMLLTELFN